MTEELNCGIIDTVNIADMKDLLPDSSCLVGHQDPILAEKC